ncbi:hypothetical protein F4821DRAFT_245226 [Hypoxylon rubiginosum]|uniref:Uncharacterized protein n=1 Tax=Hypoxylon rubiginosum TaxID=110542 RepID=A0ACC0CS34_9PEZI|nr:hypothetical protein F4821DRAFT_245226 [Hypoxylon rubiginosum]
MAALASTWLMLRRNKSLSLKLLVPAPLVWVAATSLVKLSVLFFYIAIFTMPMIRKAVFTVITLIIALVVAVLVETFFLCRPFEFMWDKTVAGGVCGNIKDAYLSTAIVNLVIDLAVVFLPMPVLWKLQMPTGKKVAVSAILGLGLLICGLTAARIKSILDLDLLDLTYSNVPDLMFGALELELGIINACLPILGPLVDRTFRPSMALLRGRVKRMKVNSASLKSSGFINTGNYECLKDDIHTLSKVGPRIMSKQTTTQAHDQALNDLENGRGLHLGDIIVRKDVYISRAPTTSAVIAL